MIPVAICTAALCIAACAVLIMKLRVPVLSAVILCAGTGALAGTAVIAIETMVHLHGIWDMGILSVLYGVLLATAMLINFFRDPERHGPADMTALVSPADGTVIYVKRIEKGMVPVSEKKGRSFPLSELAATDVLAEAAFLVGIEMNILNVHVNRAPAAGTIVHRQHIPGTFLSLRDEEAPFRNERCTTVIDTGSFSIGVVQIASRLVRRIVSYVTSGQTVTRGQRIGMIRFGSQVDIIIPADAGMTIAVQPGDAVTAGETAVAVVAGNRKRS